MNLKKVKVIPLNLNYKIIKHKDFRDVAFYVITQDKWSESVILDGFWLNQGFVTSWVIQNDKIQIMDKDIENWLLLQEDPGLYIGNKTLRDAKNWKVINVVHS
jgi:hypothetical protein